MHDVLYESEAALRLVDQGLRDLHDLRNHTRNDGCSGLLAVPPALARVQPDVLDVLSDLREQLGALLSPEELHLALGFAERAHVTAQRCRHAAGVLDEVRQRLLDVAHAVDGVSARSPNAPGRQSEEIFTAI
ncbi:MAG TPA: hypothetical protein VE869_11730 [Gemmatimonas sp.]|nr:hypothetical protein [Gemmatimonas sp.]